VGKRLEWKWNKILSRWSEDMDELAQRDLVWRQVENYATTSAGFPRSLAASERKQAHFGGMCGNKLSGKGPFW
jgi:hypothetical protein